MGAGAAVFDYDNDGDLDVYLVQGGTLAPGTPLIAAPPVIEDRLYRNDLEIRPDGTRVLRFTDVTRASGIRTRGYGMGVAAGDIDNDGDVDLYVTGFGRNQMFRNNGDGTFSDVSAASGTDDPASWGVSAAFVDFDRDGWLDLFVGNYLRYSLATHIDCVGVAGLPDYCRPSAYRPQPSRLYRNKGNGTFVDVTIASGVARQFGPALGVSTADFNGDGWIDIFVANDEQENQLWINQRDGTFTNTALVAGAALGASGERKANMGVDAGDFDADGDEDLFITELIGQGSTLYVNDGTGMFEEQSARAGIRQASLPYTGFGTAWLDVDNDGWLDILAVNGDVNQNAAALAHPRRSVSAGAAEPAVPQRRRAVRGRDRSARARSSTSSRPAAARRSATSTTTATPTSWSPTAPAPSRLLINNIGQRKHWVGLRLVGPGQCRETWWVPGSQSCEPAAPCSGDARVPTAATRRRTIHAYSSGWATRRSRRASASCGRRVNRKNGHAVPVDRYTTLRQGDGTKP